ncbi:MAG: DUF892 family protein [Gemmatimonadota bacterium]
MSTEVTRHLLLDELHELYDMERQMARALPRMAELVTLPRFKAALLAQLSECRNQVQRLACLLSDLGQSVRKRTTRTLSRLVDEHGSVVFPGASSESMNRELLQLARRIELSEITLCGCAMTYADLLGYVDVVRVLRATLEEKEATESQLHRVERLPEPLWISAAPVQ